MKKTFLPVLQIPLLLLGIFLFPRPSSSFIQAARDASVGRIGFVQDEESELRLDLDRNFGYSWGSEIQGTFTLKALGPEDLGRVVFYIDEQPIGEDGESPFQIQFHTDSYGLGNHTLSAIGYTEDGQELIAEPTTLEFVSASAGWQAGARIALPILGVVLVAALLSFLLPAVFSRGKLAQLPPGAPRSYGVLGGTICPKCGRPFAMHLFGLNLPTGKLDRCPYCGRWSLVRRASPADLAAAEAAELAGPEEAAGEPALTPEERLRRDLEESRYHDI
jgi:hypothetical protein